MYTMLTGHQKRSVGVLFWLLVAVWVTCVSDAKPQSRDVVLNIAASAVPKWKLDVYGEFTELGVLLGDKGKPINTMHELDQVIAASKRLWTKYLQHKDNWARKIFTEGGMTKPPTTAIYMVEKLRDAIRKCNFQGYRDLIQAYDAAIGREEAANNNNNYLEAKDQVKSAVIAAISLHGNVCRSTYYKRYEKLMHGNEIHEYLLGLMDFLFDARFLGRVFPVKHPLRSIGSASKTATAIGKYSDLLLDKLIALVDKTEYRQHIAVSAWKETYRGLEDTVPKEFTTEIVIPLLIEPCKEFTSHLEDIFYPAMIDLALDDDKIFEIAYKKDLRFVDIWKKFIVCSAIQQNPHGVDSALRLSVFAKKQSRQL